MFGVDADLRDGRVIRLAERHAGGDPAADELVFIRADFMRLPPPCGSWPVAFAQEQTVIRRRRKDAPPARFLDQRRVINGGGCHARRAVRTAQDSLLGFEPKSITRRWSRKRAGGASFRPAPDYSLLLRKATGQLPHGGGKRMEVGSDEYKLIRRWIAAGMPFGKPDDPAVTKISVYPEHSILTRNNKQQFAVYAHYSDGSIEDVTRRAQYESNDTEIAVVEGTGLVHTLAMSGEAAIMARYLATSPPSAPPCRSASRLRSIHSRIRRIVDAATHSKWQQLGLVPSDLCTDEQFIRPRISRYHWHVADPRPGDSIRQ